MKILYPFFWVVMTALFIMYATRPIMDLDFWWHLKTGDIMLQQKALLSRDPFNYTGDAAVQGRELFILNGYWLWQITAAALYSAWGFSGIMLLKLVTAALMVWVVQREMALRLLSQNTRVVMFTLGTIIVSQIYNLERPQVYTVIFLTLLIGMISRIRSGAPPNLMLIPMMLIWSNIHGGFVVGDILLGLATAGFAIQYRRDPGKLTRLILWAGGGILASFVNPNGWNVFNELFNFISNSLGSAFVVEYRSSWFLFTSISKTAAISLWCIALLHLTGLLMTPRRDWPEILISLFIVAFGLKHIRNAGFIAFALIPLTGWYLEQAASRIKIQSGRYFHIFICSACITMALWMISREWRIKQASTGPVAATIPTAMATFLKTSGLSGNLFNEYGIGGFLDWALYPQWQTFIDGRELDTRVSGHYLKIALGSMEPVNGRRLYEQLLDSYRIDVIAMRLSVSTGELQALLKLLLLNPEWTPAYLDWHSFVLVRNSVHNARVITEHGIDKTFFLDMLEQAADQQRSSQGNSARLTALYNDIRTLRTAQRAVGLKPGK